MSSNSRSSEANRQLEKLLICFVDYNVISWSYKKADAIKYGGREKETVKWLEG